MNLLALVRPELDLGIVGGSQLLAFAEAIIGIDPVKLDAARNALSAVLSPAAVTAASAIAGNFSKNDRIANALGIPADPRDLGPTREMRESLGLNDFKSAVNTFRHFSDS